MRSLLRHSIECYLILGRSEVDAEKSSYGSERERSRKYIRGREARFRAGNEFGVYRKSLR